MRCGCGNNRFKIMKFTIEYRPIYNTSNPASVNVRTGVITVNTCVWWAYSDFEQKTILLHEKWHAITQNTCNEIDCDEFAFSQIAGTEPNSLIQYVDLIQQLSGEDSERFVAAQKRALHWAAKNGSKEANQLLKHF